MASCASLVRNTCRTPNAGPDAPTFEITTTPEPTHERALALVQAIHENRKPNPDFKPSA